MAGKGSSKKICFFFRMIVWQQVIFWSDNNDSKFCGNGFPPLVEQKFQRTGYVAVASQIRAMGAHSSGEKGQLTVGISRVW